jgi:hypothetical protein
MAIVPPGPNDPKHAPEVIAAALASACPICNAKPGEACGSLHNAMNTREVPHARRILTATATETK